MRGQVVRRSVVGAAFVAFEAVEHVVSVDIVEFVAFARDGVWDDWESELSTVSDLEIYGWELVGLIAS